MQTDLISVHFKDVSLDSSNFEWAVSVRWNAGFLTFHQLLETAVTSQQAGRWSHLSAGQKERLATRLPSIMISVFKLGANFQLWGYRCKRVCWRRARGPLSVGRKTLLVSTLVSIPA